jgi:hypothetical protein
LRMWMVLSTIGGQADCPGRVSGTALDDRP